MESVASQTSGNKSQFTHTYILPFRKVFELVGFGTHSSFIILSV